MSMLIPRPLPFAGMFCARFDREPLGVGIGENPDLGVMGDFNEGLFMSFNKCSFSWSVGIV